MRNKPQERRNEGSHPMQNEYKYFAASNTGTGFVSYFDEIFGDLDMVYIIKGGPGTGKSHFIREIADEAEKKGYSVEYFYCSSDPLSLDGIIICELMAAVIDGTSPHSYDPKIPGIREKIINLGENWDEKALRNNSDEIMDIVSKKEALYNNIYNYLAAAYRVDLEIKQVNRRAVKYEKMHGTVKRLTKGWKNGKCFSAKKRPVEALSSAGHIVYDTYYKLAENNYVIRDRYNISYVFMDMIMRIAEQKHLAVYYSPFYLDPSYISGICIPEISVSFVVGDHQSENARQINMDRFVDSEIIKSNKQKNRFARRCLNSLFEGVEQGFNEISDLHTKLEAYYVSAMDFSKNAEMIKKVKNDIF